MTGSSFGGSLRSIHVTGRGGEEMTALAEARLSAGTGIDGDRYALRTGTYSDRHHIDRQVSLIEAETLEALQRDKGIELLPSEHRRNLTVERVALNHLVGRYFRVGECVLYGGRLNVPCKYLERKVGKPVFMSLLNRSGLNARVIVGGTIRPGDAVVPCEPSELDPAVVAANESVGLERPHDPFE